MSSSVSLSLAVTVTTAVVFSATSTAASLLIVGCAFSLVVPSPGSDHSPVPSSLVARTCTSYSVSSANSWIVASVPVIVVPSTTVQSPLRGSFNSRYW